MILKVILLEKDLMISIMVKKVLNSIMVKNFSRK